ncbi:hypothetical protein Tco_0565186 [Tanacetum coccineum]
MIPTPRHCGKHGTRAFGFGFDPITDDYKIVKISCISYDGIGDSLVYSMKTRIWTAIALPPKFDYLELESCYINGALHWAAYLGGSPFSTDLEIIYRCCSGQIAFLETDCERGEPTSTVSLTSLNSKEFNNMTSESYWLSRIRESEEAAMHHISLGFFKLALEAGCQNTKQLREELESYDCRHNLLGLGKSAKQVFHSYHILKQQYQALVPLYTNVV